MTTVTDLEQEESSLDEGPSGEEERADNLSILYFLKALTLCIKALNLTKEKASTLC